MQDWQLLREFVDNGSQAAFTILVERYVNLVYTACLRELRDPGLAEDVTQVVFVILARKADTLREETVLSGWLFNTARFASKNALKQEIRRQKREQKAVAEMIGEARIKDASWTQLEPLLHDALATLRGEERNVLLLRFFEGKSFKDTGKALGVSGDAAEKRVARALDKLRRYFARHGYVITMPLLAMLLHENAVQAAPFGCVALVAQTLSQVTMTGATGSILAGGVSSTGVTSTGMSINGTGGAVSSAVTGGTATSGATGAASSVATASGVTAINAVAVNGVAAELATIKVLSLSEGVLKAMLFTKVKFGVVAAMSASLSGAAAPKLVHMAVAATEQTQTTQHTDRVNRKRLNKATTTTPAVLYRSAANRVKLDTVQQATTKDSGSSPILLAQNTDAEAVDANTQIETKTDAKPVTKNQMQPPANKEFILQAGEIQLDGRITETDVDKKQIVLEATSFSLPSGKTDDLPTPKPKTIVIDNQTTLYVRGDIKQKVELPELAAAKGDLFAVVIGKDLGSGKSLPARQVAIWDRIEAEKYRFGQSKPQSIISKDLEVKANHSGTSIKAAAQSANVQASLAHKKALEAERAAQRVEVKSLTLGVINQAAVDNNGQVTFLYDRNAPTGPTTMEAEQAENLLPNGNFEEIDAQGKPVGWNFHGRNSTVRTDADGNHYVLITSEHKENARTIDTTFMPPPDVRRIRVTARMKTTNLQLGANPWENAHLGITFQDRLGKQLGYGDNYPTLTRNSDWTTVSVTSRVPPGVHHVYIDAGVWGPTGELALDDITITAAPEGQPAQLRTTEVLPTTRGQAPRLTIRAQEGQPAQLQVTEMHPTIRGQAAGVPQENVLTFEPARRTGARPTASIPALPAGFSTQPEINVDFATGNFEKPDAQGNAPGWSASNPAVVKVETENGNHFLTLISDDARTPVTATASLPLQPGWQRIKIKGRVKTQNLQATPDGWNGTRLAVSFTADNKPMETRPSLQFLAADRDWTPVEAIAIIPPGAQSAIITLGIYGATGTALFDDIQIVANPNTPLPMVMAQMPTNGQAKAIPTPLLTTIDPNTGIGTVMPAMIFSREALMPPLTTEVATTRTTTLAPARLAPGALAPAGAPATTAPATTRGVLEKRTLHLDAAGNAILEIFEGPATTQVPGEPVATRVLTFGGYGAARESLSPEEALEAIPAFADGTFENVVGAGDPVGWKFTDRSRTKLMHENGDHFLRLKNDVAGNSVALQSRYKLNPAWKQVKVQVRMRTRDLQVGPAQQAGAQLKLRFIKATGEPVGGNLAQTLQLRQDSEWTLLTVTKPIPAETTYLLLEPSLWQSVGTVDFDDIQITNASPDTP